MLKDYGVAVGGPADLVMPNGPDPATALRTRRTGAGRLQALPANRQSRAGAPAQAVMR
jgi:hypothetical protein